MKSLIPVLVVLACIAPAANAQSNARVNIGGTIVPSSCVPSFLGGGVFDSGSIDANTLSSSTTTNLAALPGTFSVACTAPTVVAFRITDNRQATELGTDNSFGYGLGLAPGGAPIGRYRIQVAPASIRADAVPASLIESVTMVSWATANADNLVRHSNPDLTYAFASGPIAPMSLTNATFDFSVLTTINSRTALALTQSIPLDGHATFEIVYL